MGLIQLLPDAVASQVAAGEVVERPASVVKELVENALDAGARNIEVTIQRGGAALTRVRDDGRGMDRPDALLCLERHATSKLRTGADLAAVSTLGFRGEAVPSIASVSKFRLVTREAHALAGTEVIVHGGKVVSVRDAGDAPGTVVEARSLFFNLPARRKFLRSEQTESAHVEALLHALALGHEGVGFTFLRDGREVFRVPPAARLADRVRDLLGADALAELAPIPPSDGKSAVRVRGFVGRVGVHRGTRAAQLVFVNGRPVENAAVSHGLREGYHTALMKGRHPVTVLFVELPPGAVDVNVHPAKREVRFHRPSDVHAAVAAAVRGALEGTREGWREAMAAPQDETNRTDTTNGTDKARLSAEPVAPSTPELAPGRRPAPPHSSYTPYPSHPPAPSAQAPLPALAASPPTPEPSLRLAFPAEAFAPAAAPVQLGKDGEFRLLGVLHRLYVLLESKDGLVLVDQHAAHERVLFEELRRRLEAGDALSQQLLLPVTLHLAPRDAEWTERHLPALRRLGFGLEPFGGGTFKLDALPVVTPREEPLRLLREVLEALRAAGAGQPRTRVGEDIIAKTVCRHAVKANDRLRPPEIERLLSDLLACELPYCCPHGRPTMILLGHSEIERKFGRRAP